MIACHHFEDQDLMTNILHGMLLFNPSGFCKNRKRKEIPGDFLSISRGQISAWISVRISAPFPVENSHLFSQYHVCFCKLRKVKKNNIFFFLNFFQRPLLLMRTMTHIRMILKQFVLKWYGLHYTIWNNLILRIILLLLLCSTVCR